MSVCEATKFLVHGDAEPRTLRRTHAAVRVERVGNTEHLVAERVVLGDVRLEVTGVVAYVIPTYVTLLKGTDLHEAALAGLRAATGRSFRMLLVGYFGSIDSESGLFRQPIAARVPAS